MLWIIVLDFVVEYYKEYDELNLKKCFENLGGIAPLILDDWIKRQKLIMVKFQLETLVILQVIKLKRVYIN